MKFNLLYTLLFPISSRETEAEKQKRIAKLEKDWQEHIWSTL